MHKTPQNYFLKVIFILSDYVLFILFHLVFRVPCKYDVYLFFECSTICAALLPEDAHWHCRLPCEPDTTVAIIARMRRVELACPLCLSFIQEIINRKLSTLI